MKHIIAFRKNKSSNDKIMQTSLVNLPLPEYQKRAFFHGHNTHYDSMHIPSVCFWRKGHDWLHIWGKPRLKIFLFTYIDILDVTQTVQVNQL